MNSTNSAIELNRYIEVDKDYSVPQGQQQYVRVEIYFSLFSKFGKSVINCTLKAMFTNRNRQLLLFYNRHILQRVYIVFVYLWEGDD